MSKEEIRELLGQAKAKKGKEKEAALKDMVEKYQAPEACNELGIYYKDETGEFDKALEMFEMGIRLSPKTVQLYTNEASCYVTMAQKSPENRDTNMARAVSLLEKGGKYNTMSYFFLGNLYMPKINPPFPDDYEKAVRCFKQVGQDAGGYWFSALNKIGIYYYHEKKDYVRAAAYFSLAVRLGGTDKMYKNNYELAFSKVKDRKFWKEKLDGIKYPSQIDQVVDKGEKSLIPRCPWCKSTDIARYTMADNLRKSLRGGLGKKTYYQYYCKKCGHQW